MITSQLEREHQEEMEKMEKKYQLEIDRLESSENMHKSDARELRSKCDELTRTKKEEEKKRE
jgi:hypothetical protein